MLLFRDKSELKKCNMMNYAREMFIINICIHSHDHEGVGSKKKSVPFDA